MWFDARAKLAEIALRDPATQVQTAHALLQMSQMLQANVLRKPPSRVAIVASVETCADTEFICDLLEERAAIREFDGGQSQAEAEAGALNDVSRSASITADELSQLWQISRQA